MRAFSSEFWSTGKASPSKKRSFSLVRTTSAVLLLLIPSLALALWLMDPPRKHYEIVKDVAGVMNPQFTTADDAQLASEDLVIGIVAFGEAKAFLRGAMATLPENHLIHDVFGQVKVTVTHCDITGCTRVFRETPGRDLLELRCGGLSVGAKKEMALMVGNRRLPHSSKEIPFDEVPFVVTTWGEWRKAHPRAPIFLGRNLQMPLGAPAAAKTPNET